MGAAAGLRADLSGKAGPLQTCPLVFEAQEGTCLLPLDKGLEALCFFMRPVYPPGAQWGYERVFHPGAVRIEARGGEIPESLQVVWHC